MRKDVLLTLCLITLLIPCHFLYAAAAELTFSAATELMPGIQETFPLQCEWDNVPTNAELFVILVENDTGNYWAASVDADTGAEWTGSAYDITTTNGSMTINKTLTPYKYNSFTWAAVIRDKTDNEAVYITKSIEATAQSTGSLSFAVYDDFYYGVLADYGFCFQWSGLPTVKNYQLFYIIYEEETGSYYAGARYRQNEQWYDWGGDTQVISAISGSLDVTKNLSVYAFKKLVWYAEIRDISNASNVYASAYGSVQQQPQQIQGTTTTWYLAEGSTAGGYETWLCIQNPNDTAARIRLTYMDQNGITIEEETSVAANLRYTRNINAVAVMNNKSGVATKVESTNGVNVIAERSMYQGKVGHCSLGITTPATTWYLAEGSTNNGYETWICVQNSNYADADITLTYLDENGNTAQEETTIPALRRFTRKVNNVIDMQNKDGVATIVASTNQVTVIAERAVYWNASLPDGQGGGHCSAGAISPATTWYMAEGSTNGYETWVCILNPDTGDANVRLTYMDEEGNTVQEETTITAKRRFSKRINDITSMNNKNGVATKIESINNVGIVAERAVYWGLGGGHCSIAVTTPAITWYLAEGSTSGYDTWICVLNPSNSTANVRLTYMDEDGNTSYEDVTIAANRRFTKNINSVSAMNNKNGVSTKVESTNNIGIIAERSVYWDNGAHGHCSHGYPF